VRPDRLSELFEKATLDEIVRSVGPDESVTIRRIADEKGIKVTRQRNITFWQAFVAITWFPVLATVITLVIWSRDPNSSVVVRYAAGHLAITATGIFAAWVVASGLMIWLFRYIRRS
jgi:hypothetical protein